MCRDPRLSRMAAFLGSIGIEMRAGAIDVRTLFPGSLISGGSLVVDGANPRRTGRRAARGCALRARAARAPVSGRRVARSRDRRRGNHDDRLVLGRTAGTRPGAGGCLPRHRLQGGDSSNIIECARRRIYIGFPLLQAGEMAFDEPNARLRGVKPFPHMVMTPCRSVRMQV